MICLCQVIIEEFIKPQGRFKHLFKGNSEITLDEMQEFIDAEWKKLLALCNQ